MRRLLILTLALACVTVAQAADITKGYTFTANDTVTHTKLNNLVDLGTIGTAFYTGKDAVTSVADSDVFLIYGATPAAYRKVTAATLFGGNTNLIIGRTEDTAPAGDDWLLTVDLSAGTLAKASLDNAVFKSANLINARTNWATPTYATTYLLAYDGAWSKVSLQNLFWNAWAGIPAITNLAAATPANDGDYVLGWDASAAAHKKFAVSNLFNSLSTTTTVTNGDSVLVVSDNQTKAITLGDFKTNIVWTFVSAEHPIRIAGTNVAHGLPGTPQAINWVAVCKTNDNGGYSAGDEIPASMLQWQTASDEDGNIDAFIGGANSSNVFYAMRQTSNIKVIDRTRTGNTNITAIRWRVKAYATYYP